jgi:hypothetical protein
MEYKVSLCKMFKEIKIRIIKINSHENTEINKQNWKTNKNDCSYAFIDIICQWIRKMAGHSQRELSVGYREK